MPIRRSPNGVRHVRPQPGRNRPEWVVAINRNVRSQSVGTGGRNHPVRASIIVGFFIPLSLHQSKSGPYYVGYYGGPYAYADGPYANVEYARLSRIDPTPKAYPPSFRKFSTRVAPVSSKQSASSNGSSASRCVARRPRRITARSSHLLLASF